MSTSDRIAQSPLTPAAWSERLQGVAGRVATALRRRGETVAIAETSSGGLASAALLSMPGASAYFVGSAVLYSRHARAALIGIEEADLHGMRPETEPYTMLLAQRIRSQLHAAWGLGESGAAGPGQSPYGDAPGHVCLSVCGPLALSRTLGTADATRSRNMENFAIALLSLLEDAMSIDEQTRR